MVEISSISNADIVDNSSNTRPRTLTAKGREYNCGLKRSAAIANERQFRSKLDTFKEQILFGKDPKEIKEDISALIKELDIVLQSFDQWIELTDDPDETHQATSKQTYLLDTWKAVHDTAVEIDKLQDDATSIRSQISHRSRASKRSGSSRSSCKETLLEFRAKRAALEETLKFSAVIAEQEQKLEQLKIQKELGEVIAQEQVYQKAMQEESCLQSPALPTKTHDPISTYLAANNTDKHTSTADTPAWTPFSTGTTPVPKVTVTPSSTADTPAWTPFSTGTTPVSKVTVTPSSTADTPASTPFGTGSTPVTKVTVTSSSTPSNVAPVSLNQDPRGSTD